MELYVAYCCSLIPICLLFSKVIYDLGTSAEGITDAESICNQAGQKLFTEFLRSQIQNIVVDTA